MTDETFMMQYDSTWLQEAGVHSFLIARLLHSRADTTGGGTYPSSAFCLSNDSMFNNRVMNSWQQAICKSLTIPKDQKHGRHYCWLHYHKRLASVIDLFLV